MNIPMNVLFIQSENTYIPFQKNVLKIYKTEKK